MVEAMVATLSGVLRLIPDRLPGKTRLGRMLLRPFLRDRAGCTYVLPSYAEPMAQQIFTFGGYEHGTQQAILKRLPERGSFVDVGANIGTLAIPIAKARPDASIICIEADPRIHRLLHENLNRNGCGHVHLMSCVAGPTHGQVPFYQAPDDQFGMGSLGPQFNSAPVMLEQRSLDTILTAMNISRIDVIKIDVEGAELGVLRGAEGLLASERLCSSSLIGLRRGFPSSTPVMRSNFCWRVAIICSASERAINHREASRAAAPRICDAPSDPPAHADCDMRLIVAQHLAGSEMLALLNLSEPAR